MSSFLRGLRLIAALTGFITLLILLPAILFGAIARWQVILLALAYFGFFQGTVWRVVRHGAIGDRSEDEQLKRPSGRLAVIVQLVGIVAVHWLALYDFSRLQPVESSTGEIVWAIAAFSLLVSSILISQAAIRTLGKFFDRLTIKPDHHLVDTGIYSVVRHPIYLSYILLFAGYCTLLHSFVSLGLLAAVCAVWFGNRIAIEEEMLEQKFGEAYQAYQQKTKKLFPFVY